MKNNKISPAGFLIKQSLQEGKIIPFIVISNSMSPLIKRGDYVKTVKVSYKNISKGDIVLYQDKGKIIVHRFLFYQDNLKLYIKADNYGESDNPISIDNLLAKVIAIQRRSLEIDFTQKKWKIANSIFYRLALWQVALKKTFYEKLFYKFAFFVRLLTILILNPDFFKAGLNKSILFINELRFMLLACKSNLSQTETKKLKNLIKTDLDWEYILFKTEGQKIGGLLYQNIKDLLGVNKYTIESIDNIKKKYQDDNQKLLKDYEILIDKINESNIGAIFLKDIFLVQSIYSNISLRPISNINLLIHQKDWSNLKLILEELGYRSLYEFDDLEKLSPSIEYIYLNYQNNHGTNIEIKFSLFYFEFLTNYSQDIWFNKIPILSNKTKIFSLCPEEHLIYLLINLIRNDYERILDFLDIHYFIIHYQDNLCWQEFIQKAKKSKLLVGVYYGLLFTSKLINTPIKEDILDKLKPNYLQRKLFELFYKTESVVNQEILTINLRNEVKLLLAGKLSIYPKDIYLLIKWSMKILFPSKKYMQYRYKLKSTKTQKIYFYYIYRIFKFLYIFK